MQYRYRVLGKVEQSFILRGAYFAIGIYIDFYIQESELPFVKERCKIDNMVDLQEKTETENSVLNVAKSTATKQPTKRQNTKRSEK